MRRYRIVHTTTIAYLQPARASHNELRMTPLSEAGQTTLENRVRIKPLTWSHVYRDSWGTHVTAMEALASHGSLEIEATSTVERSQPRSLPDSVGWAGIASPQVQDRSYDFLTLSKRTQPPQEVVELAESVRDWAPRDAADELARRVRERMTYQPGATGVHTCGADAWSEGRGVCQDIAHVTLGALRTLGLPARYVSGYLTPDPDCELGTPVLGASHAWIELWDGGWVPLDPTNGTPVAEDHIVVARGRDYDDVTPFKGIYSGTARGELSVSVAFTRLA